MLMMRAPGAFRSHSPANFEFPRPCRQPRRGTHHEHQRDPRDAAKEGRRLVRASLKGFAFTAATEGARCAARFESLRLKPPTPQELEERTSGSPTCRRVRGGFSFRFRLCLRGEGACRKHGRWRFSRAEISVVVAFSAAHLETLEEIPLICKRSILSGCVILHLQIFLRILTRPCKQH